MLPTSNSFFFVLTMDSMVHQTSSKSTSIFGKPFQFDGWKFFRKNQVVTGAWDGKAKARGRGRSGKPGLEFGRFFHMDVASLKLI